MEKKVNILGTEYTIQIKKYDEDEDFEKRGLCGYCNAYKKIIVIGDLSTFKGWENEEKEIIERYQKETARHEITHAFFNESGLQDSALTFEGAWAKNEEMVDWFAIQSPKIFKAFKEVGCL